TKPAASVDETDMVTVVGKLGNQLCSPFRRQAKRRNVRDLRPDVQADAGHLQVFVPRCLPVQFPNGAHRDSKLVLGQSGGDVRVRFRRNVGVHAERDGSWFVELFRALGEQSQFAFAFHIEKQDASAQGCQQL